MKRLIYIFIVPLIINAQDIAGTYQLSGLYIMSQQISRDDQSLFVSDIHGLGLFATCNIWKDTNLGIAHINIIGFPHDYCRTPLGGFYNHSDTPNCTLVDNNLTKNLVTIKDIEEGEEITCIYTLYKINND